MLLIIYLFIVKICDLFNWIHITHNLFRAVLVSTL